MPRHQASRCRDQRGNRDGWLRFQQRPRHVRGDADGGAAGQALEQGPHLRPGPAGTAHGDDGERQGSGHRQERGQPRGGQGCRHPGCRHVCHRVRANVLGHLAPCLLHGALAGLGRLGQRQAACQGTEAADAGRGGGDGQGARVGCQGQGACHRAPRRRRLNPPTRDPLRIHPIHAQPRCDAEQPDPRVLTCTGGGGGGQKSGASRSSLAGFSEYHQNLSLMRLE
mmetsp:Transcript_60692/g.144367  ORF Transcript_60692/g.144367 Transcript_60692/m.144367 type:complete len:225 (+) Transcript_60692:955-1629(+)